MKRPRHLSWENFHASIWREGQQRAHRISPKPIVEVFGDGIGGRIGLLIELSAKAVLPAEIDRLVCIEGRTFEQEGKAFLEIATSLGSLHRQFYQFATAVADRVLLDREAPLTAATAELKCFDELLAVRPLLSIEAQIGLLGELIVLERVIARHGSDGAAAWTGPRGEPHDFRVGKVELEVKCSSGTRRLHRVNGLDQMFASPRMKLYLISILLEPAGKAEAFTLSSQIRRIRELLGKDSIRLDAFNRNLQEIGWRDIDARHYSRDWRLRRPICAIPVKPGFPRLGRQSITDALGASASRIDYVEYIVNVEGLGHEQGASGFPKEVM